MYKYIDYTGNSEKGNYLLAQYHFEQGSYIDCLLILYSIINLFIK